MPSSGGCERGNSERRTRQRSGRIVCRLETLWFRTRSREAPLTTSSEQRIGLFGTSRRRRRDFDRRLMERRVARSEFGQGLSVMKIARYCLPALLLASFGGCVSVKDCIDTCAIDCRNRCYAEKAWLCCRSSYRDVECRRDFGKGFRDGYVAVASGGSTCQPAMPPRSYWHFQYQNPEGQERMLAWFNGYS